MIMIKNAMQYDQQIDSRTFYSRWYHNHSVKSFSLSLKFFWGKGERSRGRCQLLPLVATNLLDTSEGGQNLGSTAIFCKFSDMHLFFSSLRNAEHHTAPLPINYYFVLFHSAQRHNSHFESLPTLLYDWKQVTQLSANDTTRTTQCKRYNSHNSMQMIQLNATHVPGHPFSYWGRIDLQLNPLSSFGVYGNLSDTSSDYLLLNKEKA